jgi:hypothetical protein
MRGDFEPPPSGESLGTIPMPPIITMIDRGSTTDICVLPTFV